MTYRFFSVYLKIPCLSYHYLELYNLISNLKTKPNITALSETRLQIEKKPITNFVTINKQCL